jgi:catechol 2,3-dioxygenase-like lactoylglutathione lyase family enzyme
MRSRSKEMWWGTAIEAPDPGALAAFYSKLLDWPVVHQEPGTAVIKPPQDGLFMVFQLAEDYTPPVWPAEPGDQRTMMHLDIQVADLDAATADAVALGARAAEFQPQDNVRVLLDPAGHPFCLCRDDED